MTTDAKISGKFLGELVAERDSRMLDDAFYITDEYMNTIQHARCPIIVGRRGTGKSALVYHMTQQWKDDPRHVVIRIVPEQLEVYGLRATINLFGDNYARICSASRAAFLYGLLLEAATSLVNHYKVKKIQEHGYLVEKVREWMSPPKGFVGRINHKLMSVVDKTATQDTRLGEIGTQLDLFRLLGSMKEALAASGTQLIILLDKLDEGYEPDILGGGIVGGVIAATLQFNNTLERASCLSFIRDNMFRMVFKNDPDFSRNVEGNYIRLHWSDRELFGLICKRLRVAFNIEEESDSKLWNRCVDRQLRDGTGFERCLHLTLYRPRDLLTLLNEAFSHASKEGRSRIIEDDLVPAAAVVSTTRLDDLRKEYKAIAPAIETLTECFRRKSASMSYGTACALIKAVMDDKTHDADVERELCILGSPEEGIRLLYGIGFLGTKDPISTSYLFCHDGRNPDRDLKPSDDLLVHPCFQRAIEVNVGELTHEQAEDIHDDYTEHSIAVTKAPEERRKHLLGQMISQLDRIKEGDDGASEFEDWCLKAIRTVFSGPLREIELHPNADAVNRRDVVGTNTAEKGVWKRIFEDYHPRHVIFEIKNYTPLKIDDFRQLNDYLTDKYGTLGFIVSRDQDWTLRRGAELERIRVIYNDHHKLMIKLTGTFLAKALAKLRSPHKDDWADDQLHTLLDTYHKKYLQGKGGTGKRKT